MKLKIKGILVFLLLLALVATCSACSGGSDSKEAALASPKDRMLEIIRFMSAEDGGRIAGFAGEASTAVYIQKEFGDIGLKVSTQSFPVVAFACDNAALDILSGGDDLAHEVKVLTFSAPTPEEGITAEIVPVGLGSDEDYEGIDITGKIALIMRGGEYFRVKVERAYEKGAAAAVFYDPNGNEAISATLTQLSSIPALSISRSDAVALENAIANGSSISAHMTIDSVTRDSSSSNVIGLLKSGDNPDGRQVIVSAHYDGVDTPAANDNASGIAVILEMARTLVNDEIQLPYDVRFIAFGAEEIGLIGSTAYVNSLRSNELKSIAAVLNFDMVGIGDYFEIMTVEGTKNDELLSAFEYTLGQMGYSPVISNTDRSDHAPFSYAGVQAVDIQMSPVDNYHTDFDTIEAIQPENLVRMADLGIAMLKDGLVGIND